MADSGHFLVVWDGLSAGPDPDLSIQGRLYGPDAVPLGPDFQIKARRWKVKQIQWWFTEAMDLSSWRGVPGLEFGAELSTHPEDPWGSIDD